MNLDDNTDDMFKDSISPKNTQPINIQEQNRDYDYDDDSRILKELILNSNLCHKNLNKLLDFGINKTSYGPYEFCIQFEARYFINIIREYYLKLNCQRINFIVLKKTIYIYSHIDSIIQIITSINTYYMSPEKVKIMEGYYDKELKANFNALQLLKNLELHNFSKKEFLKISFKIDKNNKNNKKQNTLNVNNPFYELAADIYKFDKEFNFEDEAISGLLIIESGNFSFSIDCNYAPLELSAPPNIPDYIIRNFIFYIGFDKISNFIPKINLQSSIEISCNKYICNFLVNSSCENFFMFKEGGAEFIEQNCYNYFKLFDPMVESGTLYKKMITFNLSKQEIDALKILNKKEALLYFYADHREKYYFSKEIDEFNNITSAVFLKSKENKPVIRDIEDCCLYVDHWEDWLQYLSTFLPRDCINELITSRNNKGKKDIISNNKKNRNKKNRNEEEKKENNENNIKNVNVVDGDNQFSGIHLYSNDKKGNLSKIKLNENNKRNIFDLGRGKNINNKNNTQTAADGEEKDENIVNPFSFK